jgi:hypothetical protein
VSRPANIAWTSALTLACALTIGACGRRTESTSTSTPKPDTATASGVPDTGEFVAEASPIPGVNEGGALRAPVPRDTTSAGRPSTPVNPGEMVHVASPRPDDKVASPLEVRGEARGTWYFEASFPVRLVDDEGHDLAIGVAKANGDWMTTRFVPFTATLTFGAPRGKNGVLVLEKANPSGDMRRASELRVPVSFR